MTLNGKVALVTAGAQGIGKGIAEKFAYEGCYVYITDIHHDAGEQAAEEINRNGGKAKFLYMDITDEQNIRGIFSSMDHLDILLNNAGIFPAASLEQLTLEQWQDVFQMNLTSVFLCSKYALPFLKESSSGNIVNIASVNAYSYNPGLPAYSASKGGVIALSKQLAVEYAPKGIRVNCVSPGFILTDRTRQLMQNAEEYDLTMECYPPGRFGTVEDVAYAALFLAAEEAGFINGVDITVDGAMSLQSVGALMKPSLRKRWKNGIVKLENNESY